MCSVKKNIQSDFKDVYVVQINKVVGSKQYSTTLNNQDIIQYWNFNKIKSLIIYTK